ncbi:hypothetical protein ABK040_007687 [Willaertia magna]
MLEVKKRKVEECHKLTDLPSEIMLLILNFLDNKEDALHLSKCCSEHVKKFLSKNHPTLLYFKLIKNIDKLMNNSIEIQKGSKYKSDISSLKCIDNIMEDLKKKTISCCNKIKGYKKQRKIFTKWEKFIANIENKNVANQLSTKLFEKVQYLSYNREKEGNINGPFIYYTNTSLSINDIVLILNSNEPPFDAGEFEIYWEKGKENYTLLELDSIKIHVTKKYLEKLKKKLYLNDIDNILFLNSLLCIFPFKYDMDLEDIGYVMK